MLLFWSEIPNEFNKNGKKLQSIEYNLYTIIYIYHSLITYINNLQTDEEHIHYTNLAVSIFPENVEETVSAHKKENNLVMTM